MSYDTSLRRAACEACGHVDVVDGPDPTYNMRDIFGLALANNPLAGLEVLDGCVASETIDRLTMALARLKDPKELEAFQKLEPSNGWGDRAGAIEVVKMLLAMAEQHPTYTWRVR